MGSNPGPPSGPVLRTPAHPLAPAPCQALLQCPCWRSPGLCSVGAPARGEGPGAGLQDFLGTAWNHQDRLGTPASSPSQPWSPATKGHSGRLAASRGSCCPSDHSAPLLCSPSPCRPSSCVPARTPDASRAAGSWFRASGEPFPHGPLWAAGPAFQEPASQRLQPELGPGCARGVLVPRTGLPRTRSVNQGQRPGRPLHSLWGLSRGTGGTGPCPRVWFCLLPLASPLLTSGPTPSFSDAEWVFLLSDPAWQLARLLLECLLLASVGYRDQASPSQFRGRDITWAPRELCE